jgi:hypothetical protein
MATIALASAATGAGYTTMQIAMATALGNVIDSFFIMPALFPADPIEGARVGEISVMGADVGMSVANCYGRYARVAGQVIWAGDLEEVSSSEHAGKNQVRITYKYYTDCAVAICRTGDTPLDTITHVLADEKVIYRDDVPASEFTGTGMFAAYIANNNYLIGFHDPDNTDIYQNFAIGDKVSISGFDTSANNDADDEIIGKQQYGYKYYISAGVSAYGYKAFRVKKGKDTEDAYGFYNSPLVISNTITFTGIAQSGWPASIQRGGQGDPPTIHLGNNAAVDSHMDTILSDVPAFKDMAYVVFDSLALEDFGHRIPNFEFVVSAHPDLREVKGVMESILGEAELEASAYDCSGVSTTEVVGYTSRGPTETAKRLQPIMLAFNVVAQERGGVLYFFDRSAAKAWTIDTADIGASSGKPTGGVEVRQTPSTEKYGEVTVAFINSDPDSNDLYGASSFAQGMERAQSMSASNIQGRQSPARWSKLAVNLPITMTSDSARRIAYRLLHTTQSDDLMFTLTLPPKYMQIRENDRISFSAGGNSYKAMVQKVDIGAQNIVKIEASLDVAVDMDFDEW